MTTAVIVDAVRTAGGKRNGKLRNWHAVDLASEALKALQERNSLDPALVDDVIMGCVMQVSEQSLNIGRNAVLAAGWPESVPATTIDRQCGSSQQALHFAAQGVMAGAYDVVVAAGVESMTRTPMGSSVVRELGYPFGPRMMARYAEKGGLVSQGIGAEMIADQWGISREELDAFSVRSHQRAARATAEGRFENEIIPVAIRDDEGHDTEEHLTADEGIRPDSTVETLAKLKPAFKPEGGKITAGNSSQITDGASAVLIMSEEKANALGLRPRARFHAFAAGRRGPDHHAHRAHPGHHGRAGAGQAHAGRHQCGRDQRGLRLGGAGLGEGAPPRHGAGQPQRRRHRPRAPARCLGRQAAGHAAQRAGADRRPLRVADHVRGRRAGQRNHHRAAGLNSPYRRFPLRRGPGQRYRVAIKKPAKIRTSPTTSPQGDPWATPGMWAR